MAEIIYIRGNILVKTEDYKYSGGDGCLFPIPNGVTPLEPSTTVEGSPCLIIDENFCGSIFNSYRATGSFTAISKSSYYFNSDINTVYENYLNKKGELEGALNMIVEIEHQGKNVLFKYLFVNAITLFDSFFRDVFISKVLSSEDTFNSFYSQYYNTLHENKKRELDMLSQGAKERYIIKVLYDENFSNARKVNKYVKYLFNITDDVCTGTNIGSFIKERHFISHKNARNKDGSYKIYTNEDVIKALKETDKVINIFIELVGHPNIHI